MTQALYAALGLVAGIFGGLFGIGGAIIIIPALVYLFGLTQHQAQGTTLAIMVAPVGLLAALRYYQNGNVNLSIAVFVCLGFFFGGFIGAHFVQYVPGPLLKKMFGVLLFFISMQMMLGK
ncbi:MAG: sulfite exporter TauE/SafE family protein [Candidatus Omnitrophica bacterium]|nr:sulfite exporter TauE/SafE family protein [Candidatus Omnitrophota bacterium]